MKTKLRYYLFNLHNNCIRLYNASKRLLNPIWEKFTYKEDALHFHVILNLNQNSNLAILNFVNREYVLACIDEFKWVV